MVPGRLSGMAGVDLASGPMRLRLRPDWGGRVTALAHAELGDLLVPVDEAAGFDPWAWPKGGAYPLIPFNGRISNACFSWMGQGIHLPAHPAAGGHALHGHAHRVPWRVESQAPESATLALVHPADAEWPFPFVARQTFQVGPASLGLRIRIANTGNSEMPWDLGWHPYFQKAEAFSTYATGHWPQGEVPGFPTGAIETGDAGRLAGRTTFLCGATRFDISAPRRLALTFTAPARHLVVHDDQPGYTCAEPACAPPNAVNLGAAPVLAPGETAQITLRLTAR